MYNDVVPTLDRICLSYLMYIELTLRLCDISDGFHANNDGSYVKSDEFHAKDAGFCTSIQGGPEGGGGSRRRPRVNGLRHFYHQIHHFGSMLD